MFDLSRYSEIWCCRFGPGTLQLAPSRHVSGGPMAWLRWPRAREDGWVPFFCWLEKCIGLITENKYGLCLSGRELVTTCFLWILEVGVPFLYYPDLGQNHRFPKLDFLSFGQVLVSCGGGFPAWNLCVSIRELEHGTIFFWMKSVCCWYEYNLASGHGSKTVLQKECCQEYLAPIEVFDH